MPTLEEIEQESQALQNMLNEADARLQNFNTHLNRTGSLLGTMSTNTFKDLHSSIAGTGQSTGFLTRELENTRRTISSISSGQFENLGRAIKNIDVKTLREDFSNTARSIKDYLIDSLQNLSQNANDVTKTVSAIGSIAFASVRKEAVEAFAEMTRMKEIQEILMGVQKQALQTGMAFGEGFTTADQSAAGFLTSLGRTMNTTMSLREDVMKVRQALSTAFAARETFQSLDLLRDGASGVKSAIDLTNVALLVSKATGMDEARVAQLMAEAHLDLGASLEETALAFGDIRAASRDTGLSFEKVSGSIFDSAKMLKFYGATVESVSPLFRSFGLSMKGIGKEGLTPDLLNSFVSGLQGMSLGTKALLSLNSPAFRGPGGMIGGALRVEEAMETGKGMGDVVKSITETLKRFTGPEILTRGEAIEGGAGAQMAFEQQRRILGMFGVQGAGQQNLMLQALKDIDKNGMQIGKDQEQQLGELLAGGEKAAESTTTDLQKTILDFESVVQSQGAEALKELQKISGALGLREAFRVTGDIAKSLGASPGTPNMQTIKGALSGLGVKEGEQLMGTPGLSMEQQRAAAIQVGQAKGVAALAGVPEKYQELLRERTQTDVSEKERVAVGGVATATVHKDLWKAATQEVEQRLKEISAQMRTTSAGSERMALSTEASSIRQNLKELESVLRTSDKPQNASLEAIQAFRQRQEERRLTGTIDVAEASRRPFGGMQGGLAQLAQSTRPAVESMSKESKHTVTLVLRVDPNGKIATTDLVRQLSKEVTLQVLNDQEK